MHSRAPLTRWLLAFLGLAAGAACSDEPASTDASDSGGAGGGSSGAGTGGSANLGGNESAGGSASGAEPGSGGGSSSGGAPGEAGAGGTTGSGGGAVCGDGETEGDELCDDGFADACGSCNADCSEAGSGSDCGDAEFCEEEELGVCDCELRPVGGMDDGVIRFVALGDGGMGNALQLKVAEAVAAECALRGGCDFAVYLGDNIYDFGVESVDDPQFMTKFELPYCSLDFPFYVVLGNHDYGNGSSLNEAKGAYQLAYSALSAKWKLPDYHYSVAFEEGASSLDLFALDTTRVFFGVDVATQASWLSDALSASTANWKIAFGHHPYISNGQHGNAGNYEGLAGVVPIAGANLETFFEEELCLSSDLYLSGHDHNRQWLEADCGLEVMVSGTAAKRTSLVGRDDNTTFFEDDVGGGFALIEIEGDLLHGSFFDEDGSEEFSRTLTQ